jgi:pimeloyl-ACP methyl ester carboxylesterase
MDATPPTHHRTIPIDGVDLFYREAGDPSATTIRLLHGFPTSSRMYAGLIRLLADRFHLLAPDYPAFGQSAVPAREEFDYTFDGLAGIVNAPLYPEASSGWWATMGSYWADGSAKHREACHES